MGPPETRFARNGDIHLAYQTVGSGPLDLLLIDTWVHHVEAVWDFPDFARFLRRIGSFGRLIHFDRRGTGLSDPVPLDRLPDLETQVEDAIAVLEAAGSNEAAVIGLNDGTLIAMLLAVAYPQRCGSLVLFTPTAAHTHAGGMPMEEIDAVLEQIRSDAEEGRSGVEILAPSRAQDERFSQQLARLQRNSVRPGAMAHYYRQTMQADIRDVVPRIRTRTLLLNRSGNRIVSAELTRDVASLIPDSTFVELPGTDHLAFSEGIDALTDEIEEFLTGVRTAPTPTACSRRSCSPISSTRRRSRPRWATADGETSWISITYSCARSSIDSKDARSPPPATGSSRSSTGLRERCGARPRSWPRCRPSTFRSVRASTQARLKYEARILAD